MRPYLEEEFGNASSLHAFGRAAREGVPFGHELAVSSVYEMAEPVAKLLPDAVGRS